MVGDSWGTPGAYVSRSGVLQLDALLRKESEEACGWVAVVRELLESALLPQAFSSGVRTAQGSDIILPRGKKLLDPGHFS